MQARTTPAVRAEIAYNAVDFLKSVKTAFPFRIAHILTDRGSCFTANAFEKACHDMSVDRRRTYAYSPQTHGIVEHFNGQKCCWPVYTGHEHLKILLNGVCFAYNQRTQRVLDRLSRVEHITSWHGEHPRSHNPAYVKPDSQDIMKQVDKILECSSDVSQPDILSVTHHDLVNAV